MASDSPNPLCHLPHFVTGEYTRNKTFLNDEEYGRALDCFVKGCADLLLTDLFVVGGLVVAAAKAFESRLKFRLGISSVLPSTRVHACVDEDAVIRIMFSLSSSSQRSVFALFACVRTHPHASMA